MPPALAPTLDTALPQARAASDRLPIGVAAPVITLMALVAWAGLIGAIRLVWQLVG